jgi:hypothetical protein
MVPITFVLSDSENNEPAVLPPKAKMASSATVVFGEVFIIPIYMGISLFQQSVIQETAKKGLAVKISPKTRENRHYAYSACRGRSIRSCQRY